MSIQRPGLHQIDPGNVADGTYAVTVVSGTIVSLDPVTPTASSALVPLTTEINGVPDLVWDDDNQLVMTEAP